MSNQIVESQSDHFYARAFSVVALAILAYTLYQIVTPFLAPMLWAAFLAFLLYPLYLALMKRFKGRSGRSLAVILIGTILLLIGPLAVLSSAFVAQLGEMLEWVQNTYAAQMQNGYQNLSDIPVVGPWLEWARAKLGLDTSQIRTWVVDGLQRLPVLLTSIGGHLVLGAVNTVFGFVLMLFMLYFFMRDGAEMVGLARDLIPISPSQRQQLFDHLSAVTRAVVFGIGITSLVQGALVGVAFLITGLSAPLVFAAIAALFALLPLGGTALVWLPAVVVLMSQQRWGMVIVMIVIGVASSSVDNVLRPMLISGRAQVGTLTILLGILGGTAAFGLIGLFLGPVVLALINVVVRFVVNQRRSLDQAQLEPALEATTSPPQ
jgi:predicted PurR-regulated permease PerM